MCRVQYVGRGHGGNLKGAGVRWGRRMKRRVVNLLTGVSSALFLIVVVLWVRSYWTVDIVKFGSARLHKAASGGGGVMLESVVVFRREGDWRIGSAPGARAGLTRYAETRLHYFASGADAAGKRPVRWERLKYPYTDRRTFETRAWAHADRAAWPQFPRVDLKAAGTYDNFTGRAVETWYVGRAVWLPYWLLAAAAAAPPGVWLSNAGRRRRRERRRLNRCVQCGYDLTGNVSGVCPECGRGREAGGDSAGAAA